MFNTNLKLLATGEVYYECQNEAYQNRNYRNDVHFYKLIILLKYYYSINKQQSKNKN